MNAPVTPPLPSPVAVPDVTPAAIRPPGVRFTLDGDAALEEHLTATCERIAAGLRGLLPPRKLEAVLLGGGYGRGEGGVLRTAEGDRPYNDLEFYVCLRGNRHVNERLHGRALHVLGEILTPQAGVDVEFRITSLRDLDAAAISMFSYDLICGHRFLIGNPAQLAHCAHHRAAEQIPLHEATRLLMNRCSGLLFAAERLARRNFTPADADFVARNMAKAQLGAGDGLLTVQHQYHWSVRERQRRIERLAAPDLASLLPAIRRHYDAGVEFKLHPIRSTESREALQERHQQVRELCRETWLAIERRRLGQNFSSIHDYVGWPDKWPENTGPRNVLVNAKVFGFGSVARPGRFQHPRHRVLTALPLLLWTEAPTGKAALPGIQRELRTSTDEFAGLVAAYRELWSKMN